MTIVLQSNNTKHKASPSEGILWVTNCGTKFLLTGSLCPDKESHRIIYPNCILHTKPKKCNICFGVQK